MILVYGKNENNKLKARAMKTIFTPITKNLFKAVPVFMMLGLLLAFTQCRMDEDMNYRIVVENHCDFALKVYYDNQYIEYHDDYGDDTRVTGSVTFVPPFGSREIYSKYKSVWIEPEPDQLRSAKFRSCNDDAWHKRIDVYEQDFLVRH